MMPHHIDKTHSNKNQATTNNRSQFNNKKEPNSLFVDNRPEAIAQRKMRELMHNSPKLNQLRSFQEMANNSTQAKQPVSQKKTNAPVVQRWSQGTNAILHNALPGVLFNLKQFTGTDINLEDKARTLAQRLVSSDHKYPDEDTQEALLVIDHLMAYIDSSVVPEGASMMKFFILENLLIEMQQGSYPGNVQTANALKDRIRKLDPKYEAESAALEPGDLQPVHGHQSLSLGEADMGLARSRAMLFGGEQQVSTELRPQGEMPYHALAENKRYVEAMGGTVEFGIDATKLTDRAATAIPRVDPYQNIVFFFPQVKEESRGGTGNMQTMLQGFFRSAHQLLVPGGEIIMTFANQRYINRWKVVNHANGLFQLIREVPFKEANFPGYSHRMTQKDKPAPSTEKEEGISLTFRKIG